jgi:hypothetical protein
MMIVHSKEDREAKHRGLLAGDDDVVLFTQGGCAVFAVVLQRVFDYPIRYIPGHDGVSISHVFCHLLADTEYAVDVVGTKITSDRVWDFGGLCAPFISADDLQSKFVGLAQEGLLGESWFVEPAAVRAQARIQKYRPYFDGTMKVAIPK